MPQHDGDLHDGDLHDGDLADKPLDTGKRLVLAGDGVDR